MRKGNFREESLFSPSSSRSSSPPIPSLADEKQMSNRPLSGLSPRAETIIRRLSTITVLGLAISAAILSFSGLQQLSLQAGISHSIAWLLPVVIDGMVLTGSLGVVASSLVGIGTWYPWTLTLIGVIASIAGNVSVASHNLSSRLVHAAGPVTFALSIEGLLRIYRASAVASANRERDRLEQEAKLKSPEYTPQAKSDLSRKGLITNATTQTSSGQKLELKDSNLQSTEPTKIDQVRELWLANPDITGGEASRRLGLDASYARKILKELRGNAINSIDEGVENTLVVDVSNNTDSAVEMTPAIMARNSSDEASESTTLVAGSGESL